MVRFVSFCFVFAVKARAGDLQSVDDWINGSIHRNTRDHQHDRGLEENWTVSEVKDEERSEREERSPAKNHEEKTTMTRLS
jgi:hypothetical protein